MKYASKLLDNELISIYKLFMSDEDEFVDVSISRYDNEILLEGHIKIPESDTDYADENGMCEIEEDYSINDYNVKAYNHSGNVNKRYRKYMYEKFGIEYAENYLLN